MAKMLSHNSNGKPYPGCDCCSPNHEGANRRTKAMYKRLNRRQERSRWTREMEKDGGLHR